MAEPLLTHLERMGVPTLLDEHFPTHGKAPAGEE
jgi:hypothetical protein